MKSVKSYNVQIWVGLRVGYTHVHHTLQDVEDIVDNFVEEVKDCVTITPTSFRYVNGYEPGVIVGYINYPRFPRTEDDILKRAVALAQLLKDELGQNRVTITTPDETIMLGDE